MLKKIVLCLCLILTFSYMAEAYTEPKGRPAYPTFVRGAIQRQKKADKPQQPEENYADYGELLQQAIDLHNSAYNFTRFIPALDNYRNAKISAALNERRLNDFTKCNENLLGRYFSNPKKVWKALVEEMSTRKGRYTGQVLQDAMNGKLSEGEIDALSGIEATELSKMTDKEKEDFVNNEYLSKLGVVTEDARSSIEKNIATWEIGRDILLDLYENPNKWGAKTAKFPLWKDNKFLLANQERLMEEKRWNPEWTIQLSKPLPAPQEIVMVLPDKTSGFKIHPKQPVPWAIYQALQYNPYTAEGEMGEWFSVSGEHVSVKNGQEAIMGANRLSQQVALEFERDNSHYVLDAAEKNMEYLWNTIDEAQKQDLPFPSSLKTKDVSKWDKKQWKAVLEEDDWSSVRSAILSKKSSIMQKLKTALEQQKVDYTPVNAEQPTAIQLWFYALEQDKNADVFLTENTIKDIDTEIKSAQSGALLADLMKKMNAKDAEAFQKLQKNIDNYLSKQTQDQWAEQTKQLDEETCLGDGILNAQNFKVSDLLN